MVRYYVEALAVLGPPQPAWAAGGPYGLAFGDSKRPTLVGVNPTAARQDVVFRRAGTDATKLSVGAGDTAVQRP
jgi:hypothetical protein